MNILVLLRARKGMTLKELAEASGVAVATISRIETGKQAAFPSTLGKLASALGVDISELSSLVELEQPPVVEVEYEPAAEELAGVIEAIAQSEAEKLAGVHITKDDIVQLAARILASAKTTKQRATA